MREEKWCADPYDLFNRYKESRYKESVTTFQVIPNYVNHASEDAVSITVKSNSTWSDVAEEYLRRHEPYLRNNLKGLMITKPSGEGIYVSSGEGTYVSVKQSARYTVV